MSRPLRLCDLDFTDLLQEDDKDDLAPRGLGGSVPPPPPPMGRMPPPPMSGMAPGPPPPAMLMSMMNPPPPGQNLMNGGGGQTNGCDTIKKNKKTVRSDASYSFIFFNETFD